MTLAEANGMHYCQKTFEDHVIVVEPSGFYLSHLTPKDGTVNGARSVYTAVKNMPLELKLRIIGFDSTAVMTGKNNSCIAS